MTRKHKTHQNSVWWVSAIGAVMSVGYATLATALGASQAGNRLGTLTGRAAPPLQKVRGARASGGGGAAGGASPCFLRRKMRLHKQHAASTQCNL